MYMRTSKPERSHLRGRDSSGSFEEALNIFQEHAIMVSPFEAHLRSPLL
jgi:hypothetical protein